MVTRRLGRWVRGHRLHIGVAAFCCYLGAVALLVVAFPDVSNLWTSVFVLVAGAIQALLQVADLLDEGGPTR